jgi:hypothetical protein
MQWLEMHEGGKQTDRIIGADKRIATAVEGAVGQYWGTRRNFQKHPARTQKSLSNKERLDLGRFTLEDRELLTEGEILQQQTSAVRKVRSKMPNQKLS